MKKMFRRIVVLMCLVALFTAPCTAYAAEANPVVIYNSPDLRVIQYQPNPLFLERGGTFYYTMYDLTSSDKYWHVPAGKHLQFNCGFNHQTYAVRVLIVDQGQGVVYDQIIENDNITIALPNVAQDTAYSVILSGITNAYVYSYSGLITN